MVELSTSANFKFSIITTQSSNHSITTRKTQEPPKNPKKTFPPKKANQPTKKQKIKAGVKKYSFCLLVSEPYETTWGRELKARQ